MLIQFDNYIKKTYKQVFYRLRTELRYFTAQYASIYFSQKEKLYGFVDESRMISPNTEIVIEGFPCSANSFAVAAFKIAQQNEVSVAHHMHDCSQLIAAVKANIPAIVLVRFPNDAILSYLVRFSDFSHEEEVIGLICNQLKRYINFYGRIIKYKQSLVIADFKTITLSYDSVIKQVNDKYDTNFNLFFCNERNVEQVFADINKHNKQRLGYINENSVARPSRNRAKAKAKFSKYFGSPKLSGLLATSHNLYYEITS